MCSLTLLRRPMLIILHLYWVALAVDHFAVLGDRNINAGTPLCIDHLDGLRHRIWILTAMLHGFEAEAGAVPVWVLRPLLRH